LSPLHCNQEGDLGSVALTSRNQQKVLSFASKPKPLLAREVLEQFRLIARTKGEKAQSRKVRSIHPRLSASSDPVTVIAALRVCV
jgi:ATP-dependent DNA ligase